MCHRVRLCGGCNCCVSLVQLSYCTGPGFQTPASSLFLRRVHLLACICTRLPLLSTALASEAAAAVLLAMMIGRECWHVYSVPQEIRVILGSSLVSLLLRQRQALPLQWLCGGALPCFFNGAASVRTPLFLASRLDGLSDQACLTKTRPRAGGFCAALDYDELSLLFSNASATASPSPLLFDCTLATTF